MSELLEILFFVALSGILGLTGGFILLKNKNLAHKISFSIVSFAVGALLAAAFLDLLPHSLEGGEVEFVFAGTLGGILVFFLIEKFLIWHHHHTYGEKEKHSYNSLILIGDTLHNFIDGIILAVAFIASPQIGIPAFIAIILHEIPQEMSDFGILLHGGMKRRKIIVFNIVSALFSLVGAVIAFFFITLIDGLTVPLLAFAAGAFIYIALSDLIPETKRTVAKNKSIWQVILVILGILVIWFTGTMAHEFTEVGHDHGAEEGLEEIHDEHLEDDVHMEDAHFEEPLNSVPSEYET